MLTTVDEVMKIALLKEKVETPMKFVFADTEDYRLNSLVLNSIFD